MAINLVKGDKIKLEKDNGTKLTNICVGLNWGAIQKKGFLGIKSTETVDLDASVAVFADNNNLLETIYFGNLKSRDGSIKHSGDDRTGDEGGKDELDNEVITIDLTKVSSGATKIVVMLNSFKGQDFATIPYATMRVYEGTSKRVDSVFANYNISSDPKFAGFVALVLGKIYKHNGEWKVEAIGEPTRDKNLKDTITTVAQKFL